MARHSNIISKGIIKAMSLFGGVQILSIICAIVRTKLVALWIGPSGIGLFGLYNTAIDMINSATNLGVRSSSVRNISIEYDNNDNNHIATIIAIVRRWSWALGLIGAFLTLMASPVLSYATFGDYSHSWGFMALSVVILFTSIMNCEQAIMQGTSMLRHLAKITVWGLSTGLVLSIPLFYFWRLDGIVPSLIVYSASCTFYAWIFRNKSYRNIPVSLTHRETYNGGKAFVGLGICITLSSFISMLFSYIFMAYLNHKSGTDTVGFYQAGYTLVNKYAGLIFTAIGMEYYPRLSRVCHNNNRIKLYVTQEINISLYILIPIIVMFLLFRGLIVDILYSHEFRVIIPFISWAIMGIVFQAISWCMAFVILAQGRSRTYLVTESLSAVSGFVLNVVFYHYWGLTGLGVSFLTWYVLYTIIIGVVYFRIFRLSLHRSVLSMLCYASAMVAATFIAMENGFEYIAVSIAVATMAVSIIKIRKVIT